MENKHSTIAEIIEKNKIMVIDGSMSTALEHLGANLTSKLWTAKALEESYAAEQAAEQARRMREQATLEADVIVRAEANKKEMELAAEAEAEQIR